MAEIISKYSRTEINKEFVKTYFDLLNFMKNHVTNNKDFIFFYKKNIILKKTNVKYFIKLYYEKITKHYGKHIMDENIEYFLDNNFSDEANMFKSSTSIDIGKYISFMQSIYHKLDDELINVFINYLKKLTFLSVCYFNN